MERDAQELVRLASRLLGGWLDEVQGERRAQLLRAFQAGARTRLEIEMSPAPFDDRQRVSVVLVGPDGSRQLLAALAEESGRLN